MSRRSLADRLGALPALVGTLVMFVIVLALAAVGAWPIYQKATMALAAAGGILAGLAVGFTIVVRKLHALHAVGLSLAGYFIVGLLTAVPSSFSALPGSLLEGVLQVLSGPITAWKDLLTLTLPVGDYSGTQLPLFITLYVAALLAVVFTYRVPQLWGLAIVVLGVALLFPTIFGPKSAVMSISLFERTIGAPLEMLFGLLGLGVLLAWPIWRVRRARIAARRGYADQQGARVAAGSRVAGARRAGLGVGMALVATLVAFAVTPALTGDSSKTVGRSLVEAQQVDPPSASPLTAYRSYFTADRYNETLLTLSGDVPQRIRFATLGSYDGQVFRTTSADSASAGTAFERLPYRLADSATTGETGTVEVQVDGYSGVWLPLATDVQQVEFAGGSSGELSRGFYFNRDAQSGIVLADRSTGQGLASGDSYFVEYSSTDADATDDLGPGMGSTDGVGDDLLPSLTTWVDGHREGGATVGEVRRLVALLVQRSYLGHSKDQPSTGDDSWLPDDYTFVSSDAGHSRARIDALFASMLSPEYLDCSATVTQCAATVGDDEQYAVASALIARTVGFPSRVVYGADVVDGQVQGKNVVAWAEILASDGEWVALDSSARTDNKFIENPDQDSYRQYSPPIAQQNADRVTPPDQDPIGGAVSNDSASSSVAWARAAHILRVIGTWTGWIALLTLPIWGMLLAKAVRRWRRRRGTPKAQIVGGWNEYTDQLVDSGASIPLAATRSSVAEGISPQAEYLAGVADWAAFSGNQPTAQQATEYWALVRAERRAQLKDATRLQRWRTRLSPRSFAGYIKRIRAAARLPQRFRLGIHTQEKGAD